ncbi:MAG: response regulator, partial [Phycisphaerae bacterium]|nr:response regulator [Phycisphaerae bacterium]
AGDSGGELYGLGLIADITARKEAEAERERLEQQLRQAQKMEAVGRLAGGVAHDFNNMLTAILGNAELALKRVDASGPLHEDLNEICKAAGRSADLTRQLLAFARKQMVAPRVLDLNETVSGMLKMLRRLIGEDVELAWSPGEGVWPVRIDPSQVDQILANLCLNARDAVDAGGQISIETSNVHLGEDDCVGVPDAAPGEYVVLSVSDNGRGMDTETLENLFEPFFTTKAVGEGTGLGLATVYGIVRQNGGFIRVYSELGSGATFHIHLPRSAAAPAHAEAAPRHDLAAGGGRTVLLVEDEPSVLALGKAVLQDLGYEVLTAATPEEAIDLAERHDDIDLLLTDVVMPGMNGRELSERLMRRHSGLRRVFMSGYTADVIAHHGVLDERVHFIQKPFTRRTLAAKLREALGE